MSDRVDDRHDKQVNAYLERIAADAEGSYKEDVWYCLAACTFAACNEAKYVADVYRIATKSASKDVQRQVLARMKESLLKTGLIFGNPRVLGAFRALIPVLSNPEINDLTSLRNHIREPASTDQRGIDYMRNIFRADMDPFLEAMDKYWPDMRTLVITFIYGYYQSDLTVIDPITTSQLNIATLMTMDMSTEVAWHMRGMIHNKGTLEHINYAFNMTAEILKLCDHKLKNRMPQAENVINQERLFVAKL